MKKLGLKVNSVVFEALISILLSQEQSLTWDAAESNES